jgi:hypothetical protein
MKAHFFDINTLIKTEGKVWIVSKIEPNKPLIKISESDFNLIKKGIWKNTGVSIKIGNKEYFIPLELFEDIKIKCKKSGTDITSISFSMQEFMNPELIEKLDYKIWEEHLIYLKNSNDDLYLICSKNTERNYDKLIIKLEDSLKELGLKFKNRYFISETFYNRNTDEITHKKARLLLQHLIGKKTEGDKFTEKDISQYDEVFYYDDEKNSINFSKSINDLLRFLADNSEDEIKNQVKDFVKSKSLSLHINEVTFNKVNPYIQSTINLTIERIIKSYESFKFKV